MGTLSFLRTADWFDAERARVYPRLLVLLYAPALIWGYFYALGPSGAPDFASFWAAGRLAWSDPTLSYSPAALQQLQAWFAPQWQPFANPPPFLVIVAPFGLLPFAVAFPIWVLGCSILWISVTRRLIGLVPALAFTPFYINGAIGQNGLLTGSMFIAAACLLSRRPFVAGLLFGLLVIKPHLALLLPIAFLAGGYRRAFYGAATSSVGALAGSWTILGPGPFIAFVTGLSAHAGVTLGSASNTAKMQSVYAMLAPINYPLAVACQAGTAIVAAVIVIVVWRTSVSALAKCAVLAAATVLATPYLYPYDMALLFLPVAWLIREGREHGFMPWEKATIGLVFVSPLFAHIAGGYSVVPNLGALASALLLWRVFHRASRVLGTQTGVRTSAGDPRPSFR
ncbi:MAG TPA: glycosyltransferase family 87 protein [Phenylobacterium sp.]